MKSMFFDIDDDNAFDIVIVVYNYCYCYVIDVVVDVVVTILCFFYPNTLSQLLLSFCLSFMYVFMSNAHTLNVDLYMKLFFLHCSFFPVYTSFVFFFPLNSLF